MKKSIFSLFCISILLLGTVQSYALLPNQRISEEKTITASSGDAGVLVDGTFGGSTWQVSDNSWCAIEIGEGPDSLFFVWNNPNYSWSDEIAKEMSCKQGIKCPVDYTISISQDSHNGEDGTWTEKVSVTGNTVTARGHAFSCTGARWVKMTIQKGAGQLDEVEVFDASEGHDDTWFFAGTSISANIYKGTVVKDNFAVQVNKENPGFYPAMVRGGIPCILSTQFAEDIDNYIEAAGNCRYWAIEMGTNDGFNNGNSNVATFKNNLQTVIDKCLENDIIPVIAKALATNKAKAGWQIHDDYVTAVEELTEKNGLIKGPDFNTAAKEHPDYLGDDGIHPSAKGCAAFQKLWAKKMDSLYKAPTVIDIPSPHHNTPLVPTPYTISRKNHTMQITVITPGTVSLFSLSGKRLRTITVTRSAIVPLSLTGRCCIVRFSNGKETSVRTLLL